MKIELIKKTELEPGKGTTLWFVVKWDNHVRHFHSEDAAREYWGQLKEYYEKYGTVQPIEEVLESEEIYRVNNPVDLGASFEKLKDILK